MKVTRVLNCKRRRLGTLRREDATSSRDITQERNTRTGCSSIAPVAGVNYGVRKGGGRVWRNRTPWERDSATAAKCKRTNAAGNWQLMTPSSQLVSCFTKVVYSLYTRGRLSKCDFDR